MPILKNNIKIFGEIKSSSYLHSMNDTYKIKIDSDAIGRPFIEDARVMYSVSRMSCDWGSRLLPDTVEGSWEVVGDIFEENGEKFIEVRKKSFTK